MEDKKPQVSLTKKLVKVMQDCSYVQKDARNNDQKYTYASAGAVLEKVNDALVKHGIATVTRSKVTNSWEKVTNRGNTLYFKEVEVEITLICTETGEERVIAGLGCGMDTSDKAVMKAQTAAVKYAWLMSLQIATGDDPEADTEINKEVETVAGEGVPTFKVDEVIPAQDRAKVTLTEQDTGQVETAVVKRDMGLFKAQKIGEGNLITCDFGEYQAPNGKTFKEILAPRRIA